MHRPTYRRLIYLWTIAALTGPFASSVTAADRTGSNNTNVSIPDAPSSTTPGNWVSSPITITGAPAGAVVTKIDVYFKCIHTYSSDLVVDVNADPQGNLGNYRLWDREGGSADNPTKTVNGIMTYNGLSVNRTWYLYARDYVPQDIGQIDEWSIKVYYAAAPSISEVDPDPVPGLNGNQTFRIYGSNFVSGCTVRLYDVDTSPHGPFDKSTTFINSGEVRISANFTNNTSTWWAQVINPGGAASNQYNFEVQATIPPPSISSVSPNPVAGSNSSQLFRIYGSSFVSGCTVQLYDIDTDPHGPFNLSATFINSGEVRVNANFTNNTSTWWAQVINPGGAASNQYNFEVQAESPSPILTVIPTNPPTQPASAGSMNLDVSNTGGGNMNYSSSVTSASPWLTITSGGSGGNTGTIEASYTANTTGAQRNGTIEITADGATGSPIIVTVTQAAVNQQQHLIGVKIGVDPGHGGTDNGASGPTGLLEKSVNLATALALEKYLKAEGATVIMTRTTDVTLDPTPRYSVFIDNDVDLGISVHHNSLANASVNTTMVFIYCDLAATRGILASDIVQRLGTSTGIPISQNPASQFLCENHADYLTGITGVGQANLFMVREPENRAGIPSILAEVSFISNPIEETKLRDPDYLDENGWAIYAGIADYYGFFPTPRNNNPFCPGSGSCCAPTGGPGCSDESCCNSVCACDPFCCQTEWDDDCAGPGYVPGCGAAVLCNSLCSSPNCPSGVMTFVNPPNGTVDARQPYPPDNPNARQGFQTFTVSGPLGADAACWLPCEQNSAGGPNSISSVVESPPGTYTIALSRPITAGSTTTLTYIPNSGTSSTGVFISHPGNVNGDGAASAADILDLVDHLNGVQFPALMIWQCDLGRSGQCTPADIVTEIDLLNGAGAFEVWNGTVKPPASCD